MTKRTLTEKDIIPFLSMPNHLYVVAEDLKIISKGETVEYDSVTLADRGVPKNKKST